ncbi:hypothetical protein LJE17_09225 [Planktothrix agardhii 1031]|nr:hypothetical protein [Planktothrix agardhii 1031]
MFSIRFRFSGDDGFLGQSLNFSRCDYHTTVVKPILNTQQLSSDIRMVRTAQL